MVSLSVEHSGLLLVVHTTGGSTRNLKSSGNCALTSFLAK